MTSKTKRNRRPRAKVRQHYRLTPKVWNKLLALRGRRPIRVAQRPLK